ncbi:NAD(P)-dependent oxidoreductase [Occultella kanbiaonis]|uniref:NAD(P)-dependent oxidoreductase n=1 Tax=Occultella kanbiaonis TaxID=2675754 RepID=UPI0013D4F510|nr:NAD(P)H-binding protein [Occultella kanbiaonis]
MTTPVPSQRLAVLGAGGRTGRAITAAATARGHQVTAVIRNPSRHTGVTRPGVTVVAGDALDAASLTAATVGADAILSAVTPFTAPPASFDDFDLGFYRRVMDSILTSARANGISRIICVGLFATVQSADGGLVADDERLFPPFLRPFAAAHVAGVTHLREHGGRVDWLVLAPPANLTVGASATGGYRLGGSTLDPASGVLPLSYADLAVAILDQVDHPTRHREHLAVYGT